MRPGLRCIGVLAATTLWAGCTMTETVVTGPGEVLLFMGSISTQDLAWDRLTEDCDGERTVANHFYDLYSVRNAAAEPLLLTITATWAGGDGFLHVFDDRIDLPLRKGCVVGNDDIVERDITQSEIPEQVIEADETLMIVASTFSGDQAIGSYDIVITTAAP